MNVFSDLGFPLPIDRALAARTACLAAAFLTTSATGSQAAWDDTIAACRTQIVSVQNPQLCLRIRDTGDRSVPRVEFCNAFDAGQLWRVRLSDDGGVFLESNVADERVLEFGSNQVQMWGLNLPSLRRNQQWNIVPDKNLRGVVRFVNEESKTCLDIQWGAATNGTMVWDWRCNNGSAQQWVMASHFPTSCPEEGPQLSP